MGNRLSTFWIKTLHLTQNIDCPFPQMLVDLLSSSSRSTAWAVSRMATKSYLSHPSVEKIAANANTLTKWGFSCGHCLAAGGTYPDWFCFHSFVFNLSKVCNEFQCIYRWDELNRQLQSLGLTWLRDYFFFKDCKELWDHVGELTGVLYGRCVNLLLTERFFWNRWRIYWKKKQQ